MTLIKSIQQLVAMLRFGLFVWLTWEVPNHWWWTVAFVCANWIVGAISEYRIIEAKGGRPS